MATVLFGALGTLVGGPLGGAIGSLIGNQVDQRLLGSGGREGPRLKELAITSSSYGQPIARLYGATRAAGTIIWSTDLLEASETGGGGKGRPQTRQFSYSVSLAIALSRRPIEGVGRVWADGNLLRGEAGDLKTAGSMRVHLGRGDQEPDPLLAAALGSRCPAYRGMAYVVFEDLALADFGNRIPALSFEVFADGDGIGLAEALVQDAGSGIVAKPVAEMAPFAGFAHDGGSLGEVFSILSPLVPISAITDGRGAEIVGKSEASAARLPAPIAWPEGDFGQRTGRANARSHAESPAALRYYDRERDYQPGLQRTRSADRSNGAHRIVELPVSMSPGEARLLTEAAKFRSGVRRNTMNVRLATLDLAFMPGRDVTPGDGTSWRVEAWEWRDGGVELELARSTGVPAIQLPADSGTPWRPLDRPASLTLIEAFELPWDGRGHPDVARVHVALSAGPGRWAGAALYVDRGGVLHPLGVSAGVRSLTATLAQPLGASSATLFEPGASIFLDCDSEVAAFETVGDADLATGANRLLVGDEIVQFRSASYLGGTRWRLSGLLRGRGATEAQAALGHDAGTRAVLLDQRLLVLEDALFDPATERLAAIGLDDPVAVFAAVRLAGRSRQPPPPVHTRALPDDAGGLRLEWTRRARGGWVWLDGVEAPLVEEIERYEVGAGPEAAPLRTWSADISSRQLSEEDLAGLPTGTALWVRQVGRHSRSDASLIRSLP